MVSSSQVLGYDGNMIAREYYGNAGRSLSKAEEWLESCKISVRISTPIIKMHMVS
jgi:hypothetical protein